MGATKNRRTRMKEAKERLEERKQRKRDKKLRKLEGKPSEIKQRTIENTREKDDTMITDLNAEENQDIAYEINTDEMSNYFEKSYVPKVLITTSDSPGTITRVFCRELTRVIPNSTALYRRRASVKRLIKSAIKKEYTDIIIVNDNRKEPNALLLIHLPEGPTAYFRLSNVRITTQLRKKFQEISTHRPEVILNHFSTKLGLTVSRMLAAIFHYDPEFKGRRCVTFHNQRDYIFFRHHRYMFTKDAKPRLMELGPRFTLKLRSLQNGTFDSKTGEYIWTINGRRHELETSRRRFFL